MIEPPEMHQLVNQHVLAHEARHQHEPPVQADVPRGRARSPSRPLVANADASHGEAVGGGELSELRRQFAHCAEPQLFADGGIQRHLSGLPLPGALSLPLDPCSLLRGKSLGVTPRSPTRQRDADASVRPHADDVAPRAGMADKFDRGR